MGRFEDAIVSAKNVAVKAGKKAGKALDVSKLRFSAAEIDKEINKRYEALGRVIYDARKDGSDVEALVDECVKSIDTLYSRLDNVNMKIARIREKTYCKSCGAVVEKSAIYCQRCGIRVERTK